VGNEMGAAAGMSDRRKSVTFSGKMRTPVERTDSEAVVGETS